MIREIKFRGKRIDNGELACGHLCYIENEPVIITGYVKQTNGSLFHCNTFYFIIPETVGQYTGLKDKNGREIYEGDIIKGTYYDNLYKTENEVICQVRWDKSGYWTFSGTINFLGGYLSDLRNIIVIGNIYENPELLEGN